MPSPHNIFWIGFDGLVLIDMQHDMIVVGHDSECSDVNIEEGGKTKHIVLNLVSPMFIGTTRDGIHTT